MKKSLLSLIIMFAFCYLVSSQNTMFVCNYVANFPKAPIGFSCFFSKQKPENIYFYLDFKGHFIIPSKYYDTMDEVTASRLGGEKQRDLTQLLVCDLGIGHKSGNVILYSGLGLSYLDYYAEFYDSSHIYAKSSYYLVDSLKKTKWNPNLNAGILLLLPFNESLPKSPINSGISFVLGFDTTPVGINLGIGVYF